MHIYKQVLAHQFSSICAYLETVCHQKDEESPEKQDHKPKGIVVLDLDETCLVNLGYAVHGTSRREDPTPALEESRVLFEFLKRRGIPYAFITARTDDLYAATIRDLQDAGFAEYALLYMRSQDSTVSEAEFKRASRASIETHGYSILCTVGDQVTDLHGLPLGQPFLLFNPYY